MNKVKILREQKNLTQNELAEKSGISLRTIQRIESGSALKGFSLHAISKALEIEPEDLFFEPKTKTNTERAKLINFSALSGLVIPFGGIIFPLILISKTKDHDNKILGKSILSIQIILTVFLSISLIVIPFVQKYFSIKKPLFIYSVIIFLLLKFTVVIINGISLNKRNDLYTKLKINFL